MYFMALATDYDGTIAHDGIVPTETIEAFHRLKASGRRLILVTGREMSDLERVFPELDVFDLVVAENGALLYTPATKGKRPLGPVPPPEFVAALKASGLQPLSVGEVIVATWEPNEALVLDTIRALGLDLQIIFNKGAVMVLPSGITKASGLLVALDELGLSAHNVVAVGDAENDLAFMRVAGCSVAVGNALPAVMDEADVVTTRPRGKGVVELIDRLIGTEDELLGASIERHGILLGTDEAGAEVHLDPGGNILIAGTSGGGKSTVANGLLERMAGGGFQFCILDPEGDYADLDNAIVFGDAKTAAGLEQVLNALQEPKNNVVVNLLGIDHADRPGVFAKLYATICGLRESTARPHWLIVDEAHHMLPHTRDGNTPVHSGDHHPPMILITVHPDALADGVMAQMRAVIGVGDAAADVLASVAAKLGRNSPMLPARAPNRGETLVWMCASEDRARLVKTIPPEQSRRRHTRKYAEGALGEDKSFYFRGPRDALNLRAQNLMIFLQMADGVDEETFVHHLKAGDYSDWFRTAIKDEGLAQDTALIERDGDLSVPDARSRLRAAVEARYTAPA